ncbi:MAG: DUF995 domain-containing protein [Pseudomonadota bacterium]|nr:DUF995 domain-containing protein [Pseudomonadota bacterium]
MYQRSTVLMAIALLLAACSKAGDGSALPALTAQPSSADPAVQQLPDGPLESAAIESLLTGRTWHYEAADFRGTITFNADGTIDYDQSGEGRGTGRWHVANGKLCESFDPGPVVPEGRKDMCFPFRRSGGAYFVSDTKLTLASQ